MARRLKPGDIVFDESDGCGLVIASAWRAIRMNDPAEPGYDWLLLIGGRLEWTCNLSELCLVHMGG